jgi:hypothetical protein
MGPFLYFSHLLMLQLSPWNGISIAANNVPGCQHVMWHEQLYEDGLSYVHGIGKPSDY